MTNTNHHSQNTAAIPADRTFLYVSLELGRATWLVTTLLPGSEKMSRRVIAGGDARALVALLGRLKAKAEEASCTPVHTVVIQEVGMDGFWIHRVLQAAGIESWLVDPASVAVPRKQRRAKTDKIDGEALIRVLVAYKRGEPRVCTMVVPPSPDEEDRRRLSRERDALLKARIQETNRIRGLLFAQGVRDYDPLAKDRRARLRAICTGDGRALPPHLMDEIARGLDRLELILSQLQTIGAAQAKMALAAGERSPVNLLTQLRAVGPSLASTLWGEALYRTFENRRQLAAYAGLAPTPWRSGKIDREQGISKAGNARLRSALIELAWLWIRWQPTSQLSLWFTTRVAGQSGRVRKIMVVALARKLLVALWRYCRDGVIPEGAILKAA
jgi:transposase